MIRVVITSAIFATILPVMAQANGSHRAEMPDWQTDAENCSWNWREGGGIGPGLRPAASTIGHGKLSGMRARSLSSPEPGTMIWALS